MDRKPGVRAVGGIFFRSSNPKSSREWYQRHLGLKTDEYGTNFAWRQDQDPEHRGFTQWSAFKQDTQYFGEHEQQFMINYRVDDLESLVAELRKDGIEIVDDIQHETYGKFVHIVDCDEICQLIQPPCCADLTTSPQRQ